MAQVAALVLLVLGLLPIANWIPGGHDAPWYQDRLTGWLSGGAIVLGAAIIAAITFRRYPDRGPRRVWGEITTLWHDAGRRGDAILSCVAFGIYAVVSRAVLSGKPLLIDEIIQVYQARIFASGRLYLPAPAYPEFSSSMHLIDWGGKVYGQFPAGGPAMLALGSLIHMEWIVGPVAAGLGVYLFARLLRRIELRRGAALAALLCFAFAPFCVFLDGSMMNHVTTTTWLIGSALALVIATGDDNGHPAAAFWCGLALGVAAAIRPLDAAAFGLPTAAWLLWRARAGGAHLRALLASGLGVALPVAGLLLVNAAQTGDPFRFGYIEMWGKSHELGFHESPWGAPHTPARGLELVNLYLLRLQTYFLETPAPSLLFATAALAMTRRLTAVDRWAITGSGLLLVAYFAYWHDGFYLGPRFVLPLAPWLALWTMRLPAVMSERQVPVYVTRGVVAGGLIALAMGLILLAPLRALRYRNGMVTMRTDLDGTAAARGVKDALVLVRESWGAQLVARMWRMGVSRFEAERIYRSTDACRLEEALTDLERRGGGTAELLTRLAPIRADSARLVTMESIPDTTEHFLPGSTLSPRCFRRITEDRAGFTLYSPTLLARGNGIVYARDLHARDSLLLAKLKGRPLWLLLKPPGVGSALRLERVSVDSMLAEWRID